MLVRQASIAVCTGGPVEAHDVTEQVRQAVRASGVGAGIVLVSVPHTTCAVCVNENEPGLRADLERLGRQLLDPLHARAPFEHDRIDDNARAHLTSVLLGHQTTPPIEAGEPVLGTWQRIFLLKLDGPRQRTLNLHILGA